MKRVGGRRMKGKGCHQGRGGEEKGGQTRWVWVDNNWYPQFFFVYVIHSRK